MLQPGNVVLVTFVGADTTKRRPAVVVSSMVYHNQRPDVILEVITSRIPITLATMDYVLQDWASAGLHQPSAFRSYFNMALPSEVQVIGTLSARDWQGVQNCIRLSFHIL